MLVKVKAGKMGFYGGQRLKAGETFDLKDGDPFSDVWMEKLEQPKPPIKKRTRAKTSKSLRKEDDV